MTESLLNGPLPAQILINGFVPWYIIHIKFKKETFEASQQSIQLELVLLTFVEVLEHL